MSDLHTELLRGRSLALPDAGADVVVLAGDIGSHTRGLQWARAQWPQTEIILVPGNHEYYRQTWATALPAMRRTARELGIHFLEQDTVELGGVRFLGCTGWTDFDLYGPALRERCMREAARCMNDYVQIALKQLRWDEAVPGMGRRLLLTPEVTRRWHQSARSWLEQQLALPFGGPTVVVTHHLPHLLSVPARFAGDLINAAYASNLHDLFGKAPLWLHGHTHDCCDYALAGTRVVCNPRGYPLSDETTENPHFQPDLVVELERGVT